MERWGRSDLMRECLRLHQHEFAERTRQRHVLLFVCVCACFCFCEGVSDHWCAWFILRVMELNNTPNKHCVLF